MNAIRKIGILGLGAMGAPMARHLVAKGYNVAGHDPVDAARRAAVGISIFDSPREVANASDLVIVVVGFDHEVEAALFGAGGVMEAARPGLVIAIGSTIAPRHAKRLAERAAERGVVVLDAPLARGEQAAIAGKLLVFHLGGPGAGQVAKMVNNLVLWACTSANDEGLRLAEALGVDAEKLRAALHHSSAQNWSMDLRAERSGMPWAEKDMNIALHEADLARLSLPLCGTVKETIKALKIRLGYGLPHGAE
ncbi:MAG TPA: NAD(P)-dependent oxidoreductase [Burkholderiales bacterium]|nr:NAD(P)-dependent oxidoreductase [Burkholderiales bacterium]